MLTADIIFEELPDSSGQKLGRITLNRPKALNALTHDMFSQLHEKLLKWKDDATIKAVLIKSSSEKAFCAGGDIRAVYEKRDCSITKKLEYFQLEYQIDPLLHEYPKPYIAFLNGITMGGGVGISLHGSHPVATERLQWAMPETKIGFFPDVGVSYQLSRLSDDFGLYLGLTGNVIGASDVCGLGLINQVVSSESLNALEDKIIKTPFLLDPHQTVTDLIAGFQVPVKASELVAHREAVSACFAQESVELIIDTLNSGDDFTKQIAQELLQRSPTSLKVTLQQVRAAKEKSFDAVMATDYRLAERFLQGQDFFEGIRAAVVDKDRHPKWQPDKLSEVGEQCVKNYFKT